MPDATPTTVLTPVGDPPQARGGDVGDRLAETATDVRVRVARLDVDAKLAWAGALLATLAFLVLPYSGNRGPAAEVGGRLWWRPLLALATAILVTVTTRRASGTRALAVAAVATGAAAATESGLFALVSSPSGALRAGFYLMLLGACVTLVAAVRAALRSP